MKMPARNAWMLNTCLTATLALAISSGSALALQPATKQAPAIALNATQQHTVQSAFAWLDRDAGLLNSTITPRTMFIEQPGVMERSGQMAAKVKDKSDMIKQIAIDTAQARLEGAQGVLRGAATDNTISLEQLVANRMQEARTRLAPSLVEGFMDVDVHTFTLPAGMTEEAMAEILMQTGDYEYVEPDWLCYPTAVPNDPSYNSQWWHGANRIDTERAWDYNTGSSTISIAICDTGIDLDHPDLVAGILPGFNSASNLAQVNGGNVNDFVGHGTMVAGCAAAQGNNGTGIPGIGWNFKIIPVRVTNSGGGTATISDILQGARWGSDEGAFVSNCSYGGASSSQANTSGNHIRSEGHLLVFSSGNDGLHTQPNDWPNVTIVGASTQSDITAGWSDYGAGVDVVAPGANIFTTNRFGGYSTTQGTSFSSPITSGALALIHSANPALSADEVEQRLFDNCEDKDQPGEDDTSGWGRINVGGAVFDAVFGPSITSLPFTDDFATTTLQNVWKNPVGTVEVNDAAENEPSGDFSMNLDATDAIETLRLRAGFLEFTPAHVSFWTQHKGVESGETLLVEYLDFFENWATLTTVTSDGNDQSVFGHHRFEIPLIARHDDLKFRFTAQGSDSTDNWYIDDVIADVFTINPLPWADNFETGINTDYDWESSDATQSGDATNAPAGGQTALLQNSSSMTSQLISALSTTDPIYIRAYTQHKGVESGETLTVEYLNAIFIWNTLGTITSDGNDQTNFTLNQWTLPLDGVTDWLQIRITTDGDEADDRWFVDDVAVSTVFIDENPPCPADINGDGALNIFDFFAYLDLFNASDLAADFTGDGLLNIFDVFAYLDQFNSGCP